MSDSAPLVDAAVRTAVPLLLASAGEGVSERGGVINIGMEGCIIAGAFAAFVGGASPAGGYAAAVVAGGAVGALFAVFAILLRRDQVVVGAALTMLALGLTGALFRLRPADAPVFAHTEPAVRIPGLADVPLIGSALFHQPLTTYLAFAVPVVAWWWLRRTHAGLALRAIGDSHETAQVAGIRVRLAQAGAVLFGSAMGGLAGGTLVLAQAGSFAEGMSAGRGFLAIAIVALGRWRMGGIAGASIVFGAAMALQYVVQAMGWGIRYELVLMVPYLATLVALGAFGRGTSPPTLGQAPAASEGE